MWRIFVLCFSLGLVVRQTNGRRRLSGMQKLVPLEAEFPCSDSSLWRSPLPPTSVHRLRPGDIDVVAALGDSLTAGSGALADNLVETYFFENRGVSWSVGGEGTWRQYLTVPNLLKVMNPNLTGFSTGDGPYFRKSSNLNLAFNGAMDQDMMMQAEQLVDKMRNHPGVDFQNHWKLITVMVGTNDICSDQCYKPEQDAQAHGAYLHRVLEYLRDNLPRTLVNLVSMPYIPAYTELKSSPFPACHTLLLTVCSCLFGGNMKDEKYRRVLNKTREFQQTEELLVKTGLYDVRDDFTVVFQPTLRNAKFPRNPECKGQRANCKYDHDYSYLAIDCFHYSQKLHAGLANTYWNNLFQEEEEKTSSWSIPPFKDVLCPTSQRPFIQTSLNSGLR